MSTESQDMPETEVPEEKIEEARAIGEEIRKAIEAAEQSGAPLMAAPANTDADAAQISFTSYLPENIIDLMGDQDLTALEAQGAEFCTLKANESGLMTSKFGCSLCTTGLYFGIAALIGGAVVLSGGMSIPAVLAASGYSLSGLAVVISAMTGVSVGAVTAIIGGAQITLGLAVLGLCEAMGKC